MTTRIGDPIHLIETSIWYAKLEATRTGYRHLAEGFGENCDVRFCDSEIPATILITDTVAYYEPYLHVNLKERLDQSMLTFEVEVSKTSHIYRHSGAFFELLWQTSIPFTKFEADEDYYKHLLRQHCKRRTAKMKEHTQFYMAGHALISDGNRYLVTLRSAHGGYMPRKWDIPGGTIEPGRGDFGRRAGQESPRRKRQG